MSGTVAFAGHTKTPARDPRRISERNSCNNLRVGRGEMGQGEELFGTVYDKGQIIFRETDRGDTMFLIQSGAVQVTRMRDGREEVLALLEKGEFFGEMALVDQRPRSATVKTISRARLLSFSRESLMARARQDSTVILQLMHAVGLRIKKTNRMLRTVIERDETLRALWAAGPTESDATCKGTEKGPWSGSDSAEHPRPLTGGVASRALQLPASRVPLMSNVGSVQCFQQDQEIFREYEDGDAIYFIIEGSVEIGQKVGDEKYPLARLGSEDFFGEMAIIGGGLRTATATALTETLLRKVSRAEFLEQVTKEPAVGLFLLEVMINRLRSTLRAMESPTESPAAIRSFLPPVLQRSGRLKVAMVSLSACGGCGTVVLDDQETLANLNRHVEIVFCPMLMDAGNFGEVDIVIVDGAVRAKEDEEKLREARSKSRLLVAWGTCAAFGGIPALANRYELEQLIEQSYAETVDPLAFYFSGGKGVKSLESLTRESGLLRKASRVNDFAKVDYYLPGCPPDLLLLSDLIRELVGGKQNREARQTVCSACPRKPRKAGMDKPRMFPTAATDSSVCFLSTGAMCMGFLTMGGCGAPCTAGGFPCWGCRGPSHGQMIKLHEGDYFEELMLNSLSRRWKLEGKSLNPLVKLLRRTGVSALSFAQNFVHDASRLR